MKLLQRSRLIAAAALVAVMATTGCASSAPDALALKPFNGTEQALQQYDHLLITCEAAAGVAIPEHEQVGVVNRVKAEIEKRAPGRFAFVEARKVDPQAEEAAADAMPLKVLRMHVLFVEYDEGDAAARLLLAGLGQMHIATDVTVRDQATQELLGEYKVSKQFAFGGIYGATTDMEDVEEGLAKGIAEILTPEDAQQG